MGVGVFVENRNGKARVVEVKEVGVTDGGHKRERGSD